MNIMKKNKSIGLIGKNFVPVTNEEANKFLFEQHIIERIGHLFSKEYQQAFQDSTKPFGYGGYERIICQNTFYKGEK